ncbi:FAD-binding protein, partial [Syntrophomonas wolfei]
GEIACSKPVASDKKWLGEERIVGLSGKICKPQLAIILGVSGQVQFTVGIRDAGTIISINNDEKALMNNMADYVMIADLKEVLPDLNKALG